MGFRNIAPTEGQRTLLFEGERPRIPDDYDRQMAREAAKRRHKRVGVFAVDMVRVRGFRQHTDGLWVPHSKGEMTSVTKTPNAQLVSERIYAKDRVRTKYADAKVEDYKVERWADYASRNAFRERKRRFRSYRDQAVQQLRGLEIALDRDRTYDFDSLFADRRVMMWMKAYAVALKGYGQGRFTQPHWTKRLEADRQMASEFITRMTDAELLKFYDEAVWATWSRMNYWQALLRPTIVDPTGDPEWWGPISAEAEPDGYYFEPEP